LNRLKKIDLDVKKALTIYFQIRKFGCFDRMGMTFSVIVPTYNRLNLLKNTLESLYRQDYADFEIIVVNDGSTDGTDEFLASLAMQNKISYLKHPNQGLAATRTAGLGVAAGEYIAFTDDDCVVPVTWLRTLKEAFQQETVAGIGGATHTGDRKNPSAEANDMINNFFKRKLNTGGSRCPYFTGNNMAFKKSSLLRVGGPDARFRMDAEDRDLVFRLHLAGEQLLYLDNLIVDHYNDVNLWGFIRHQYDQGKGSYLFYSIHSRSGTKPAPIPAKVYMGLLLYPFLTRPINRAFVLCSLAIIAQAAVSVGFMSAWLFHGRDSARV